MQCKFIDLDPIPVLEGVKWIELMVQDMLNDVAKPTFFITEPSDRAVVITWKHINENVDVAFCKKNDIKIVRMRAEKGGPAYNAVGNTIFYIIYPTVLKPREVYEKHNNLIIEIMEGLGVVATVEGNNIKIGTKKIGIASHHMWGKYICSMVFILRDFDFDTAEKAILQPDLHERLTTLKIELGLDVSHREVVNVVKSVLENGLNFELNEPTQTCWNEEDLRRFSKAANKYKSEKWQRTGRWSPVKDYGR